LMHRLTDSYDHYIRARRCESGPIPTDYVKIGKILGLFHSISLSRIV
jgi:hypothetical protein